MQPDVDMSVEQLDPHLLTPAARIMIYVIIKSQIVMTITDMEFVPLSSTDRIRTLSGYPRIMLWKC